jgi:ankyrin repeat protein
LIRQGTLHGGGDGDVLSSIQIRRSVGVALWAAALCAPIVGCSGGCDRTKGATDSDPSKASAKQQQPEADAPAVVEDPAVLLYGALNAQMSATVEQLLTKHPELLEREIYGDRPLWRACARGSLAMAKSLVGRGASLKVINGRHQSILWPAVKVNNVELVKYLIEKGADPKQLQEDDPDPDGSGDQKATLLWAASSKEMATLLIDAGVDPKHRAAEGNMAIHVAAGRAWKDVVRVYLDAGVDVETPGRFNMRALHKAASAVKGDPESLVLMLLNEQKADINAKGYKGYTALHECSLFGRGRMAELLLARGADVTPKNDEGNTPRQLALLAKPDRMDILQLLYKYGDKDVKNDLAE